MPQSDIRNPQSPAAQAEQDEAQPEVRLGPVGQRPARPAQQESDEPVGGKPRGEHDGKLQQDLDAFKQRRATYLLY